MSDTTKSTVTKALSTDDLGQQIEALRADLLKLAATITGDVSGGVGKASHQIAQSGRDAQATATHAVRGNPLAAVGIAAGLGLLLGLIARKG